MVDKFSRYSKSRRAETLRRNGVEPSARKRRRGRRREVSSSMGQRVEGAPRAWARIQVGNCGYNAESQTGVDCSADTDLKMDVPTFAGLFSLPPLPPLDLALSRERIDRPLSLSSERITRGVVVSPPSLLPRPLSDSHLDLSFKVP